MCICSRCIDLPTAAAPRASSLKRVPKGQTLFIWRQLGMKSEVSFAVFGTNCFGWCNWCADLVSSTSCQCLSMCGAETVGRASAPDGQVGLLNWPAPPHGESPPVGRSELRIGSGRCGSGRQRTQESEILPGPRPSVVPKMWDMTLGKQVLVPSCTHFRRYELRLRVYN